MAARSSYIGRFAPSPTGPLHAGSLVAAMASYLDARANHGRWLVRIEDVDQTRSTAGVAEEIMRTLVAFGMHADATPLWQSQRSEHYLAAFERLQDCTYPCACTRKELADSRAAPGSDGALIYPGTCRHGLPAGRVARSCRLRVPESGEAQGLICFKDRLLGEMCGALASSCGDFILKRADGGWAYQLAVVVDDAAQGVTHVVRGADLFESTPRQIYLQRLLGLATLRYLHVPVVVNALGEKLSKQTGAVALDCTDAVASLQAAAQFLGLAVPDSNSIGDFWEAAILAWRAAMPGA